MERGGSSSADRAAAAGWSGLQRHGAASGLNMHTVADEEIRRALDEAQEFNTGGSGEGESTCERQTPRVFDVREFLALKIPRREYLLEPILREKETAMLHAWRGVGKTFAGLQMAFAVASGGSFWRWRAPRPRPVLYIDGEMPARTMQERLAAIVAASDRADDFDPANLQLICADLQDAPLPNLSTIGGQMALEPFVEAAHLVVVDSISTLAGCGRENEAESWFPMQEFALKLRRRGKSVLFLHHDGKSGAQRGTSRKEDILDVIIHLRRPSDYEPQQGARFEVHFPKARGLHGETVEPFEARLEILDGRTIWTMRRLEEAQLARAAALYRDGASPRDVARDLDVHLATAYRLKKRAEEGGLL
jgi:putative DNA primase/helicase